MMIIISRRQDEVYAKGASITKTRHEGVDMLISLVESSDEEHLRTRAASWINEEIL